MINKKSTRKEFLDFYSETCVLNETKKKIVNEVDKKKELLAMKLNERYSEQVNDDDLQLRTNAINKELNLILRSCILDNRKVIRISSTEDGNKCVTRSYGWKNYKGWGSVDLDLKDKRLTEDFNLVNSDDIRQEQEIKFSKLINHPGVEQEKIKDYFNFLRKAIEVYQEYKKKVESLDDDDENGISIYDLKNTLSLYSGIEEFEKKVTKMKSLDLLREKYLSSLESFREVQDKFFEEIEEYNKPFKLLVQLQESNQNL